MTEKSSLKAVFDALSDAGSADGCDGDWCHKTLQRADPKDIERVKQSFHEGGTENEIAHRLGIWPY